MNTTQLPPIAAAHSAVAIATPAERNFLISTLFAAFKHDPVARWFFPDEHYHSCFGSFADAFGGRAFEHGSAYYTSRYAGAALWLLPEVAPDEERMMALIDQNLPAEKRPAAYAIFEQMGLNHPKEPHWYLPLLGVKSSSQSQGHGGALLSAALAECDEMGATAYLESSNPRNLSLYHRHGFRITGEIRVGSCPPIFPMTRLPRR